MIETYLLEHLQAFYENGTLSAAAQHLNMAQPSLSRLPAGINLTALTLLSKIDT